MKISNSLIQSDSYSPISLGTYNGTQLFIVSCSCAVILSMVLAVLGIKFKWFKRRLDFEHGSNLERGSSGIQSGEPILLQGVFHQQDAESFVPIERPAILPPVRIRKSSRTGSFLMPHDVHLKRGISFNASTPSATNEVLQENVSHQKIVNNGQAVKDNERPLSKNRAKPAPIRKDKTGKKEKTVSLGTVTTYDETLLNDEGSSSAHDNKAINNTKAKTRHFDKLKDGISSKDDKFHPISERRPTGFVRPPKEDMDEIMSPISMTEATSKSKQNFDGQLNILPTSDPNSNDEKLINFNQTAEESENIFEKVKAKPKPEPRKVFLTLEDGPESAREEIKYAPSQETKKIARKENDTWSAVSQHRLLAQELARHHKLKPVNKIKEQSFDESFHNPLASKPRTLRDMKKSKPGDTSDKLVLNADNDDDTEA